MLLANKELLNSWYSTYPRFLRSVARTAWERVHRQGRTRQKQQAVCASRNGCLCALPHNIARQQGRSEDLRAAVAGGQLCACGTRGGVSITHPWT